jgi:hypothetical protein
MMPRRPVSMNPNGPFPPGKTGLAIPPATKPNASVHIMLMRVPARRDDLGKATLVPGPCCDPLDAWVSVFSS